MREITTLDLTIISQTICGTILHFSLSIFNLNHKIWNDAMKLAPLEMQWLSHLTNSFLPRTQGSKIFSSFGYCLSEQSHENSVGMDLWKMYIKELNLVKSLLRMRRPSSRFFVNFDIEINLVRNFFQWSAFLAQSNSR